MDIQENHKEHVLKTDHVVFQDVLDGNKTFEIRFNDRDYQVGDLVILKETEFTGEQMKSGQPLVYTGREIQKRISYVLSGYGLHEGWVILGIQDIKVIRDAGIKALESYGVVQKKLNCANSLADVRGKFLDQCNKERWKYQDKYAYHFKLNFILILVIFIGLILWALA